MTKEKQKIIKLQTNSLMVVHNPQDILQNSIVGVNLELDTDTYDNKELAQSEY